MKKFIFSKFADLQAYTRQLYYQMNPYIKPPLSNSEEPSANWGAQHPMFPKIVGTPVLQHIVQIEDEILLNRVQC